MRIALVYDFPPFETGLFDAAEFLMAREMHGCSLKWQNIQTSSCNSSA